MPLNRFRDARGWPRLLVCFLLAAAWINSAQPAKDESADIAALRAEVRQLASELLQHRAEFTRWKVDWLTGELQRVQAERQRLGSERRLIEGEIGDLNQASTNSPGAEDEDRKQELSNVQLPALLAGERAAGTREATLATALSAESARMSEIEKRLQLLAPQISNHK